MPVAETRERCPLETTCFSLPGASNSQMSQHTEFLLTWRLVLTEGCQLNGARDQQGARPGAGWLERCSRGWPAVQRPHFNSGAASLGMSEAVNPGRRRRPSAAMARQPTRQERVCRGHPGKAPKTTECWIERVPSRRRTDQVPRPSPTTPNRRGLASDPVQPLTSRWGRRARESQRRRHSHLGDACPVATATTREPRCPVSWVTP